MKNISPPHNGLFLKKHYFVFFTNIVFFLICQLGFAQVNTYGFSETISSYSALSTSNTAYTAPWDNHVTGSAFMAPIGFTFNYDGINQTQCYISPNGYISFGVQPASTNYLPLSVATPFTGGGTISALGMDLISGTPTDNIVYNTIGTSPNRIFVVQWTNARRKVATGNFNFQIRLIETTNVIEISYGLCAPDDPTVYNTQVGIRGVTNDFLQGDINNRLQNGANTNLTWSGNTTSGIANSSTVRSSLTEYPNNGLRYTFTPSSPCGTPTASPTSLLIGSSSVSLTSFVGNSFTAAAPAPTNYLVVRSTVNTTPTNINIPNRVYWAVNDIISGIYTVISTSNATSFTQTGLTSNTTYYYWVIPYNANCLGGPIYKMSGILNGSKSTCITAPTGIASSNADGNSFTASWNTVAGASDYQIDVSTSNTFSPLLPTYTNVSSGGSTSLLISGLIPLTTYYFRVRAVGISCGIDSSTGSASTLCGAYSIPYSQNFDTTPVLTVPNCFTVSDDNLDTVVWQIQNTLAASSPNCYQLRTNTPIDSNDWFFMPGLNLTSGISYRLKFKYNTTDAGLFAENLRVRIGSNPSVANMNITLLNLPNLNNTAYQTAIVDFTPISNDTYYIGFQGYSFSNQSKILIDDISVIVSPTCFEPTNVTATVVGVTTATITWSPSIPAPANGYNYYVSTSNATPSNSVTPTGSVGAGITTANITGLSAATLYYVWVRGNCGGIDSSEWSILETFGTDCSAAAYLPVVNGTLCGGGSTTLQATGTSGSIIEWYAEASGATLLATGTNFVTPTLYVTTTYYARSKTSGGLSGVGPFSPTTQGGSLGVQSNPAYLSFSVFSNTTFQSFDIYPMVAGQTGIVYVRNAANSIIGTYNYVTSVGGGNTPQTIPIGLSLTPGNYFLNLDTLPTAGLVVNIDSGSPPYISTITNITGNDYDNTFYLYAYNWKFTNICRSLLTPVTANISPPPALSFSSSSATICYGFTTPLITVSGYGSYNNFVWSPNTGISGSLATGFTFNPTATTNYSLTASQTSGSLCATLINFTVNVNAQPPAITISPATTTLCQGVIQPLNASLAAALPVTIFSENFNGATVSNWTTINSSIGGISSNADWTLRDSPYFASSPNWNRTFSSNDASRFYFTDSDAQGPTKSNTTQTYLVTPTINLAGYTSASLSFWQYLRYIGGNRARVEASIDGGVTWIAPPLLTQIASQGTSSGFVNTTVNLSSLLGNSNVKLRFYYLAHYDYGWAIDNVSITGTLALEVVWSPATGLYFDSTASTPYIAGTPTSVVYAKPTTTTTYSGTALGSNGCTTSSTTTLTILSNVIPGVLSSSQIICGGFTPNNLVLTGSSGSIVRWEYATNATFTSGLTTIANTTTTLTTAAIGSFTGDRYYRVVLQNSTCPVVYSTSVLISFPTTVWDGMSWSNGVPSSTTKAIFSGNYSSTGDLYACSVQVTSGTVFFNTGHTLTIQNDLKVTGGSLSFDNNSSLVQVNTLDNNGVAISNTGNITYSRTTTPVFKYDYTYWSTPVSPQLLLNVSPLSPANLFLQFNAPTNSWQYISSPSTMIMVAGKGYICRAPSWYPVGFPGTAQAYTASFIGVPNTGTITIPITGGASQFNLLGNPYPSALSADAFLLDAANAATLGGTIYLWTHNTPLNASYQYSGSDYAIYNYLGGTGTSAATNVGVNISVPNGKIASGQGFFIKGLSSGTATFKNSMRVIGNNNLFFKMAAPIENTVTINPEKHRYWLNIYNTQGAFKEVLLGYVDGATLGLDRLFDGEMVDPGNVITMYSMVDNTKLSIQGRPLPFDILDTIPLGYKSTIASTYSISLSDFDGLFTSQDIFLEDKLLSTVHNLKDSPYTFTTGIGDFGNRFLLRYTAATLGTPTSVFTENTVVVYKNANNDFVINTGSYTMESVKLFDIRGRLLLDKQGINASQTIVNGGSTNEVLLVQIKTVDGIVVTKKVIR